VTTASPLGRYDDAGDQPRLHRVQLLNLPVRLLVDGRDRHDSLLREFALLALAPDTPRADTPRRLVELTQVLGVRYAAAGLRPDDVVDEALARGEAAIDLTYDVPADAADVAARLEELMAQADELCRDEALLTLPRTPLQLRFSQWYVGQFRSQVDGQPPQPWDGPLDP
jgi:hypothetical protein